MDISPMNSSYLLGMDVGSTTVKTVILSPQNDIVYEKYCRHHTETLATLRDSLAEALQQLGNIQVGYLLTGSAGMGIAEKYDLPFIQEVVASAEVVRQHYAGVRTLIDIGGEDAKIIFFENGRTDIRMNGSCAGGTGAFIDEMATLLNVPVTELDSLAAAHQSIYPMASRCGVFAKTDLQNLLSRQVAREDIAASVFHAVVLQILATLARGRDVNPKILFSGGPLTFLPSLKQAFLDVLDLTADQVVDAKHQALLPAWGAALAHSTLRRTSSLKELLEVLSESQADVKMGQNRHRALFASSQEFIDWNEQRDRYRIERRDLIDCQDDQLFLGIDSGSTTTKIVLTDSQGRVVSDYYASNGGNSIQAVQNGLNQFRQVCEENGVMPGITRSMVTGYGEDLIRAAFGIDDGMVETLAHYRAARALNKDVSFILDIGGQDMKAIFVKDGSIENIEINEACSSGCGSFIESFARSMGYQVSDFARIACGAQAPYNLGTRCTVFMNSRVKQALREGAAIQDISAGLAYSVIKNALYKVLKITSTDVLGDQIVVQGGTFRNPAVHKALEELIGKPVICPDMAELMGAYGAALAARDAYYSGENQASSFAGIFTEDDPALYQRKDIRCKGCENNCVVTKLSFANGNHYYSGNRCERIFTNGGRAEHKGVNVPAMKYELLFNKPGIPAGEVRLNIGIPRVLNLFENYPFWHAMFQACGFSVTLSSPSSHAQYQAGAMHIMSENLCFPAKLVSGHIMELVKAGVDRIFYPMVLYEKNEFADASNSYNCPVVSGYPDVIKSSIDPHRAYDIPLDMPAITFRDENLLRSACRQYLTQLGVSPAMAKKAIDSAYRAQQEYQEKIVQIGAEVMREAQARHRHVVLLMGRPYHIDPLINHNIPELLTDFGADVITEDCVPLQQGELLKNRHVMTQWEYVNRYYHAARWVGKQDQVELVQLNSFGCGPDPFVLDEVRSILAEHGKRTTVIRIDEIESAGSTRLRLRSMMESLEANGENNRLKPVPRKSTRVFQVEDRGRTLIVPDYSPFCSPPIIRPFIDMGYHIIQLDSPDQHKVDVGLKYTNNEICYPGIICIGSLIEALQSGKYDLSRTAIGFSQTGGQCRASSYASMIKKAMLAAGFDQVPLVTLSTNFGVLNEQPGFEFNTKEYSYKAAISMMFTDALSDMYHSTIVREKKPGSALQIARKYLDAFMNGSIPIGRKSLLDALGNAVSEFNNIEVNAYDKPKVGIVGEIYVKYNAFSNNFVADWLMSQGLEVVMPSFLEFFLSGMYSSRHGVKTHIKKRDYLWLVSLFAERLMEGILAQFDSVMQKYRHYHPVHSIRSVANRAKEILSLNHQYGESWLIAGEIASLARDGVNNVLCLQPFGCIANHIVAKGVQKRMLECYPQLNLLFLDADAGVSEVNFFNRLHFFIDHAMQTCENGPGSNSQASPLLHS